MSTRNHLLQVLLIARYSRVADLANMSTMPLSAKWPLPKDADMAVTLQSAVVGDTHMAATAEYMAKRRPHGTDLVLQLFDRRLYVHAALMAAHSQLIAARAWPADQPDEQLDKVDLSDLIEQCLTPEGLNMAVDFAHKGQLHVHPALIFHALAAAIALKMNDLLHLLGLHMVEQAANVDMALYMLELAVHNDIGDEIRRHVLQTIGLHFEQLTERPEFRHLSIDAVYALLSCVYLDTEREANVFYAIVDWMSAEAGRAQYAPRLLDCIRYDRLSTDDKLECVAKARQAGLPLLAQEACFYLADCEWTARVKEASDNWQVMTFSSETMSARSVTRRAAGRSPVAKSSSVGTTLALAPVEAIVNGDVLTYRVRVELDRDMSVGISQPIRLHIDFDIVVDE